MKNKMPTFASATKLTTFIDDYFSWIAGSYHWEEAQAKTAKGSTTETSKQKVWDREPEPPTLTGLALHLGFNSKEAFEEYEREGRFADILKRARLRIEAEYEKKLHFQSSTGAIFALKSMGWTDKDPSKIEDLLPENFLLKVEILKTGPSTASSEQAVHL
ncbi:hypothetical protein KHS38_09720 [Mucilaginibacter sp. Bleaf8]|uniref:terminase small subunit n=1 Tax=Mucilaginibacter sp. Bleaf8 TaxID=2834430 RepID=UPI001BCD4263|nr:terminase small subunit [Mucilaginibacter sp. Bleaf8]MBS7564681.1 hypothetical protein [Mucilaginibacter sp. Bleaf8]